MRGGPAGQGTPLPPADLQPTVEWQVCGACNYNCSYCIQSPRHRKGAPSREMVRAIIDQLGRLPGSWEIKISGGEPLAYRHFVDHVAQGLMRRTSHTVSVLTNLSAPLDTLARFCQLTGDRLRITSASFHPHSVPLDAFVEQALAYAELRRQHNPHSSFVVNVVLEPGQVQQHLEYQRRLQGAGLRYFPQLMKIPGGVFPYTPQDAALIEQLTGGSHDPRRVNRAPSYQGLRCDAGRWYFVVDQHGEAFACRTAKRHADAESADALGNLVQGSFALRGSGGRCPFNVCPCTVPANRGVVRGVSCAEDPHGR